MDGVIGTKHLFTCAVTIVREFGWRVYIRCWMLTLTKRHVTFLECICLTKKNKNEKN